MNRMYSHETDISTQQEEEKANVRLPQADEERKRARCPQAPQKGRKKALNGLRGLSFPKSARILKNAHFKKVSQSRNKWAGKYLYIDFRIGCSVRPQLGLTVTR